MVLVFVIAVSVLIGLLSGGSIRALGAARFRFFPLIFVALIVQVIIFTAIAGKTDFVHSAGPWIYVGSIALVIFVIACNLSIPGMKLVLIGTLLNAAAIVANGGFMPATDDALRGAGIVSHVEQGQADVAGDERLMFTNSKLADDDAPLLFLGDIFYVPESWLLSNVFSIGDILIGLGAGFAVIKLMRRHPQPEQATSA